MAVANVHTLYAVNIATAEDVDAFIDQINDQNVNTAIQEILQGGDGAVDPTFVATMSQIPRIGFSTSDLATALGISADAFLTAGLKISSDVDDDGLEAWFHKVAEGGTRSAGATHIKLTVNEGILLPRQLSAVQGGVAMLAMECICTWDGTNNPIVIATAQALEGTPAVSALHTVGPVKINGVALAAIQSMTYDPGLVEIVQGGDGQVWPTFVAIMTRQPLITLTTLEAVSLSTFGLSGTAQGVTDSVVYLRKIAEGAIRVADATAEHISLTIDEGMIRVATIGGSHGAPLMSQIEIRPTYDGTNAIVVIDTTAAIT